MPKLARSDWYDLSRDTNWTFRYVTEEEVFPEELSGTHRVSSEGWLAWDEPYKVSYREYVHNQVTKDTTTYSVKNAIARSKLFDNLDPGWKSAILAHYGAITMPEYLASSARRAWAVLDGLRPGGIRPPSGRGRGRPTSTTTARQQVMRLVQLCRCHIPHVRPPLDQLRRTGQVGSAIPARGWRLDPLGVV